LNYVTSLIVVTKYHTYYEFQGQEAQAIYEAVQEAQRQEKLPFIFHQDIRGNKVCLPGEQIAGMDFLPHPNSQQMEVLDSAIDQKWMEIEKTTNVKSNPYMGWIYEGDLTYVIHYPMKTKEKVSDDPSVAAMLRDIETLEEEKQNLFNQAGDSNDGAE
jgi:hypothetical protein